MKKKEDPQTRAWISRLDNFMRKKQSSKDKKRFKPYDREESPKEQAVE
jgi:hypothetical protein